MLSIILYSIVITVGEVSARTITNNTSGNAKDPIDATSKNVGQKKKQIQQVANINT